MVLSATAPLALNLAQRAETGFSAPLLEIYGCTESGQIASRRPADDLSWQLLPGVQMRGDSHGAWASGGHIEGEVPLSDYIDARDNGRFELRGRHADMDNIVGKRTSMSHLNTHLQAIPGVVDGCFLQPDDVVSSEEDSASVHRLVALVV